MRRAIISPWNADYSKITGLPQWRDDRLAG